MHTAAATSAVSLEKFKHFKQTELSCVAEECNGLPHSHKILKKWARGEKLLLLSQNELLNYNPFPSQILFKIWSLCSEHIDERKICNAVTPDKDVDGFHVINVGRMCLDQYSMLPATPWGVWEIIKRTGIPTLGKNVVVAGRSKNVGMPIAMLLHTDGRHERPGGDATVTISHRYTPKEQLKQHTIRADIVVAAAGIPNLITADMIKEGAAVIDVGITRVQDPITAKSRLVGDVDFEGVKKKASYITPVPGGVGPMTVAMLMKNTIIAAKKLLKPKALEALTA
ncbi:bifunctional methylenetetrahydrofolate dehydrogenase/cyclohydrolase, mitochondrial isoform X3 [Phasianus colchicus]|uniref:bifunctional methylenetetrahydrofolate dehydrogenase/cyclohydrolase, mitochondrial isoform X3 n=1 Tax=Phasianus colchicus TaxID=9054 RepID=UPI00129DA416|nr:bifunctional methylenetetrahydrofolate dehydrogenase/cyclohydrolase, mitochondrial isoform X3 [Phasianus colchicus]